ncbi:hypothetical protein Taro_051212 [Colocasia esculenta]|uniref:Uncharacterized protein n=1 Tax=Colocasia esculenta TaxID=4460 RepID=A0A843XFD8_COLES|nr:hypothetical protein [Colocasia esculenta]
MGARICCSVISRVVPHSRVTILVRNSSAVVRRGRADDLLGDIPPRGLTVSDQGGRYLGDLITVLKRTWPVEMGPRLLTGRARAVVGHHGTRWSDLATTGLLFLFGTPPQLFGVEGQMTCSGIYRREA